MTADTRYDALAAELTALGRAVPLPPHQRVTETVITRLAEAPTPARPGRTERLLRRAVNAVAVRRRSVVAVATALLVALVATPPVRATVLDWFGFAGVVVRQAPTPEPASSAPPPTVAGTVSLDEARRLVAFEPLVPAELGAPQAVEVSGDRRLLSMGWTGGPDQVVRLDQFDGRLDYVFAKSAPGVEYTEVGDAFALWFDEPHEVVVLDRDGTRRTETARLAGHTLIWEHGPTTLRLEGDLSQARALEIARSVETQP
ncbi:MAG TPA: hypothetical protein VF227_01275 [Actinomycetes bacterium]